MDSKKFMNRLNKKKYNNSIKHQKSYIKSPLAWFGTINSYNKLLNGKNPLLIKLQHLAVQLREKQ